MLHLERWNPEAVCHWKEVHAKEVWVRVLRLPLHLWCWEIFRKIGDCCGGFVPVDEGTVSCLHL